MLSAMSLYCMDASLFAKEQIFLINGMQIQDSYHEQANLSFLVEDDEKDQAQLFVKSSSLDMKEIKTITWQKVNEGWIGHVDVLDGDDVQYELKIHDESFLTPTFDKDTTPYSMKFYEDEKECGALQDTYHTHPVIKFQFFDPHQKKVCTHVKKDGEEIPLSWCKEQEECELLLENGIYEIHFEMEDAYGNVSTYDKRILVDDTLPTVTLKKDGVTWEPQVLDQDATFTLHVADEHFDIAASKIYLDDVLQDVTWESDENGQFMTFSIFGEKEHELRYEIIDTCGNKVDDKIELAIDQSAPILHLFEGKEEITSIQPVYDHTLQLRFQIEEAYLDYEKSYIEVDDEKRFLQEPREAYLISLEDGIHHIHYHFEDQVHHVLEGDLKEVLIDQTAPDIDMKLQEYQKTNVTLPITITEKNMDQYWAVIRKDGKEKQLTLNWKQQEDHYVSNACFDEEGVYEIEIGAVDQAKNRTVKTLHFTIDKTAPQLSYTYQDQDHGQYLNHARTLCWDIKDTYLDQKNSMIEIVKNGNVIDVLHSNHQKQDTLRYQIKQDGTYDIHWHIVDLAGNVTSGSDHFIIDQTAPSISLQALTDTFSNQFPYIQYMVEDEHLSDYALSITRNKETTTYRGSQSIQDAIQLIQAGYGEYEINLSAKDLAGNVATSNTLHLIYDPIAPTITTTINHQAFPSNVPYITNKDVNIQTMIQDTWLKQAVATLYEDGKFYKQLQGNVMQLSIGKEDGKKHQYELSINAFDMAGNLASTRYFFVIDCYKPTVSFQDDKHHSFPSSYTPALNDDQKELSVVHWTLKRNGEVQPYLWNQPIEEEGEYELSVDVRDQAMNRWELSPYHFTIDKQAPVLALYDIDHSYQIMDHGAAHAKISLYIDQKDAHKRSKERFIELSKDGQKIDLDEIKYDENGYAYYSFTLDHTTHIYALAQDEAGNITEFNQIITPVEEEKVKEEIKESRQYDPQKRSEQLEENETKSDKLIWSFTAILFTLTDAFWYGLRKRRNHHS